MTCAPSRAAVCSVAARLASDGRCGLDDQDVAARAGHRDHRHVQGRLPGPSPRAPRSAGSGARLALLVDDAQAAAGHRARRAGGSRPGSAPGTARSGCYRRSKPRPSGPPRPADRQPVRRLDLSGVSPRACPCRPRPVQGEALHVAGPRGRAGRAEPGDSGGSGQGRRAERRGQADGRRDEARRRARLASRSAGTARTDAEAHMLLEGSESLTLRRRRMSGRW